MNKLNLKLATKYFPRRQQGKIDTTNREVHFRKNEHVLLDAFTAWTGMDSVRKMAERNKLYTFSDQWSDKITDPDSGRLITEREHILQQGNIPLQNNRIRGIVRSILGVYQSAQTEPICVARERDNQSKGEMMSSTLQYVYQLNKLKGLDTACFTNFLITGLGIFRSSFGWQNGKMDVWTDLVNYNRFFVDNHMEDPRHWDCHLIGEIHDMGLLEVMSKFADGSREKAEEIRQLYSHCNKERTVVYADNLIRDAKKHINFFVPMDETRCRVIQIWKLESKERLRVHDYLTGQWEIRETEEYNDLLQENENRITEQGAAGIDPEDMRLLDIEWFIDTYWYYYFLTPQGDVLKEGETDYWHKSHPYSFRLFPFFNGQIFPFVSDFIDQQRYINRLITLQDFILRASAKGVLAIHEDSIPEGMSAKDFADEWAVFNGVIVYKGKPGTPLPQQISVNTTQLGTTDMLALQLKLLEDISGVHGALQGQAPKAGTAAALYMQQIQNSTTSLSEMFEAFRELREDRDTKNMKLIQQFYDQPRFINLNSNSARYENMIYNPETVRDAEFDLSITESTSTPAYRMIMNEFLMDLFRQQQISLVDLLQHGSFPFADKLLQSILSRQEDMQAATDSHEQAALLADGSPAPVPEVVPPEIQQAVYAKSSPIIQQLINS